MNVFAVAPGSESCAWVQMSIIEGQQVNQAMTLIDQQLCLSALCSVAANKNKMRALFSDFAKICHSQESPEALGAYVGTF